MSGTGTASASPPKTIVLMPITRAFDVHERPAGIPGGEHDVGLNPGQLV